MKKCCFLLLFISATYFSGLAQLKQIYAFQKDDSILKRNYFEQSMKKKNILLTSINAQYAKDYKEIYNDQFKEIGSLLLSSRSVTAPKAYNYLQSVLQKIMIANPELKGTDVRVIFSRDWWPNAYSLGEGTIAINAGLMIFLENEAQLVFVLCHELSHYYLQHTTKAIKKYIETINSDTFQKELKRLSKEEYRVNQQLNELTKSLAFDSRRHSRTNEAEADMQAFNFMKKTGYDCNAIKTSLELLDKIDDSSLYKHFDIERTFNFNEYSFKKKWIEKESTIFSQLGEKDSPLTQKEKDSLKTHPDCAKRILLLVDSLQKTGSAGKLFLVDEKLFAELKKDFSLEIAEQCYRTGNLSRNLYYCLLLLQGNENIPVAVYSIVRCLNDIYENQKNHQLGLTVDRENKIYPADYNLLLRMLSRLRLDEIATLNYCFCKKYYDQMKDYPEFDNEIKRIQKIKN